MLAPKDVAIDPEGHSHMTQQISRRSALRAAAVGAAGLSATLAGCSGTGNQPDTSTASGASTTTPVSPGRKTLVAFFSRAGENYYYGGRTNLAVGNTEVVGGMIRDRTGADLYKIDAANRYPDSYDEAVDRNRDEQASNALPAIAGALPDIAPYDVVILGSPVWSSRAPRIMSTFIQGVDLSGKTVLPLVTYAVSGMSGIDDFYRNALTAATVERGLAVQGEEVREAGTDVDNWLRDHDLLS
jgi:flavodoxin